MANAPWLRAQVSGIGMACAVALAEAGADVTFAARRAEVLNDVVSAVSAAGYTARALALDVSHTDAVREVFEAQPYDIVVNSAGLARHSPAVETTEDDFDAVMSINVRAAYFFAQQAAKAMIAAGLRRVNHPDFQPNGPCGRGRSCGILWQ